MKTKSRIYYKDRYTNEIWYYETVWPSVSYEYLEQYMKLNNKIFLYITNINGLKEKTQCNRSEHKDQFNKEA